MAELTKAEIERLRNTPWSFTTVGDLLDTLAAREKRMKEVEADRNAIANYYNGRINERCWRAENAEAERDRLAARWEALKVLNGLRRVRTLIKALEQEEGK